LDKLLNERMNCSKREGQPDLIDSDSYYNTSGRRLLPSASTTAMKRYVWKYLPHDNWSVVQVFESGLSLENRPVHLMHRNEGGDYQVTPEEEKALKEAGAIIYARNRYGQSLLHLSCLNGNSLVVTCILDMNARKNGELHDVYWKDNSGNTPLILAVRQNNCSCVGVLLSYGIDADEGIDQVGKTPLTLASSCGYAKICSLLLENGADINKTDSSGMTALTCAVAESNLEIVNTLLCNGAVPDHPDNHRQTLLLAVEKGNTFILQALLKSGCDPSGGIDVTRTYSYHTDHPLISACVQSKVDAALTLIAHGANVEARDIKGNRVVHYACKSGSPMFLVACLKRGARVNIPDEHGDYPINILSRKGYTSCLECFLCYSKMDYSNAEGKTPIQLAVEHQWTAAVQLLLDNGSESDDCDKNGTTVVMSASALGNMDILRILMADLRLFGKEHLAKELNRTNYKNENALSMAITNKRENIALQLIANGANVNHSLLSDTLEKCPLVLCAKHNCCKVVKAILGHKDFRHKKLRYDITIGSYCWWYGPSIVLAVDTAVKNGMSEIVREFILCGYKTSTRHLRDILSSNFVYRDSKLPTVKVLVDHGNINICDDDNQQAQPVVLAVRAGAIETSCYLVSKGADPLFDCGHGSALNTLSTFIEEQRDAQDEDKQRMLTLKKTWENMRFSKY
jgi:ankyrin repeat protein